MRLGVRGVKNCQTGIKKRVGTECAERSRRNILICPVELRSTPSSVARGRTRAVPYVFRFVWALGVAARRGFHFQQSFLAVNPPAVSGQVAVGAEHAMAWNCDGNRIGCASMSHRAHG